VPFGRALADAFVRVRPDTRGFGRELQANLSRDARVAKASDVLARARRAEADQVGRLRVAETRLGEVRANGKATATQIARAEEALAAAGRRVQSANERVAASTRAVADAQQSSTRTAKGLGKELQAVNTRGFMPLATAAVGLGPALIPALAGATAGAAGFGVALASGGAALGVFGAVAKDAFKDVQDNAKLAAKGTADLSSPLGRATRGYLALGDAWERFVQRNQPAVFTAMGAGFNILTTALPKLQPLFNVASRAVGVFEAQLSRFVSGGGLDRVVHFLAGNAGPALEAFRQTLTNIGRGVGSLSPLFARFSGGVEAGMVRLSAAFADWAGNAGRSGGFQAFLNYVVATAPTVVSTLHELASAAVNIAKGLAPLGPLSLSFVGTLARLVSALPPGAITAIAGAFVSLQLAIKGADLVSKAFSVTIGRTPIGLAALAVAGLITVFLRHSQVVADSRVKTEAFAGTLNKATSAITGNTAAMAANNLETAGAFAAADRLGIQYYTVTQAALGNKKALAEVNAAIQDQTVLTDAQTRAGQYNMTDLTQRRDAAGRLTNAISETNGQIAGAVEKNKRLHEATTPATAAMSAEATAAGNTARQMSTLATALLKVAGINLSAAETDLQFRDSVAALTQSVQINGRTLDINSAKGRANRAAVLASISAALAHAGALGTQTGSQVKAQRAFQNSIPAILAQAAKLHLNRAAVDALIASVGGLHPKTVPVATSGVPHVRAQINGLVADLNKLPATKTVRIITSSAVLGDPSVRAVLGKAVGSQKGMRVPGYGGGDIFPAMLEPGETVVPKHLTSEIADWAKQRGIPGFAAGGRINVLGSQTGLPRTDAAVRGLHSAISRLAFQVPAFSGNASVASVAAATARLLHRPGEAAPWARRIMFESGGRWDAVNRWDSNWAAGHPSVGGAQVIAGTFARWAGRFRNVGPFLYGVSTNPLANSYAGGAYAVGRYGSLRAVDPLIRPRGYDRGGWLPRGASVAYNGTGRPERVLPDAPIRLHPSDIRALIEGIGYEMRHGIGASNAVVSRTANLYGRAG
jgi:hypothetical protein